ncbi:RICIN domain-containing protein [Streptomyces sp. NPDC127190]|uniref:RICIN domain-containing protein n=1 Tax=unclassified Streptomyces TaxID=2593676 RepID=UPI00362E98D2
MHTPHPPRPPYPPPGEVPGESDEFLAGPLRAGSDAEAARCTALLMARHWQPAQDYAVVCLAGSGTLAHMVTATAFHQVLDRLALGEPAEALRPRLLVAVRDTVVNWSGADRITAVLPGLGKPAGGRGMRAAKTLTPENRALSGRAFHGLPRLEQTLLWHTEVEAEEIAVPALLLGIGPESAAAAQAQARDAFRDGLVRAHRELAPGQECRYYNRLLDIPIRRGGALLPDVQDHLAGCAYCRHAAEQLGHADAALGLLLAEAVLGWGARRYLDSRPGRGPAPGRRSTGARRGKPGLLARATLPPARRRTRALGGRLPGASPFTRRGADGRDPGDPLPGSGALGAADGLDPGGTPPAPLPNSAPGPGAPVRSGDGGFGGLFEGPGSGVPGGVDGRDLFGPFPGSAPGSGGPSEASGVGALGGVGGLLPVSGSRVPGGAGPGDPRAAFGAGVPGRAGGRRRRGSGWGSARGAGGSRRAGVLGLRGVVRPRGGPWAARERAVLPAAGAALSVRTLLTGVGVVSAGLLATVLAVGVWPDGGDGTDPVASTSAVPATGMRSPVTSTTLPVTGRPTRLRNAAAGLCLDIKGTPKAGAGAVLAGCSAVATQQWTYETDGLLRSAGGPDLCLDSHADAGVVILGTCAGPDSRRADDVRYDLTAQGELVPRWDRTLALATAGGQVGADLVVKVRDRSAGQRWQG